MKLQTTIDRVGIELNLDHESKILLSGSCFAQNIGKKLSDNKFCTQINPLGISYNPISLFNLLQRSIDGIAFNASELEKSADRYFTFDLHSIFSGMDPNKLIERINHQLDLQSNFLSQANCIFISLGTAWVHRHKESNLLVNNCHKLPAGHFDKMMLSVEDIVDAWDNFFAPLSKFNQSDPKIVFTVSPVRHLKDGFHENQLSKSTLLLAVEEICNRHQNCFYFPSYEIMMDELRDYRFYDKDLVHPSELAIEIIWDYFKKACLSQKSNDQILLLEKLMSSLNHKAFEPNSANHQTFLKKLLTEFEATEKNTSVDLSSEINELRSRILS